MRAYRLVDTVPVAELGKKGALERFGLRLGPVLCRSGAEQETFARVYAAYVAELRETTEVLPPPAPAAAPKWYDRFKEERWVMGLLGLVLLGMLARYLIGEAKEEPVPDFVAQIEGEHVITEYDTLTLVNRTLLPPGRDSSQFSWTWTIYNADTFEELFRDSTQWSLRVRSLAVTPADQNRRAALEVFDPQTGKRTVAEHSYRVECGDAPPLRAIVVDTLERESGLRIPYFQARFDTVALAERGHRVSDYEFRWVVDSNRAEGETDAVLSYVLTQGRTYHVRLTAYTPEEGEFCATSVEFNYTHGTPRVVLPPHPYDPVDYERTAGFRAWWVILLLLLSLFWILGARRIWLDQIAQRKETERRRRAAAKRPKVPPAPDAAPYGIPWVNQEALLPLENSHLRLARAMRHRAGDGGRRELDAPKTLRATVRAGGFPTPRFSLRKRAGEYVMLIDEIDASSHQGRLFKRLASELNRRDVYAEVYFYQRQFNRVWNAREVHGISLEEVARRHGGQRLLILGNGHDLIDQHADGRPELTERDRTWLPAFPERILLTPVPPVAWGYQEKTLYRHFPVFPADTTGILHAANYLQAYGTKPKPDFDALREDLRQQRAGNPDPRHQRWRRAREVREYFASRPDLLTWASALAVHPAPNFDLTVAIGRALEPFGVAVNHDNLLALSRWPALHEGHLRRRLREELLADLPAEVETAARAALAEELKKARPAAVGGNAARELEGVLAVQSFSLDHEDAEARAAVAELLREGALSSDALKDLRREVALEDSPQVPNTWVESEDGPVAYLPLYATFDRIVRNPFLGGRKAHADHYIRGLYQLLNQDIVAAFPRYREEITAFRQRSEERSGSSDPVDQSFYDIDSNVAQKFIQEILAKIKAEDPIWASETDFTGRYTAAQTVARMIETGRLAEAVSYLNRLQEQDFPELDKQREALQQRLTAYLERQSPPFTKAQKAPRRKTTTPNLAATALRAEIEQLAGSMDRIRQDRANEREVATQQRQRSLSAENVSLEAYFLEAEPTEQEKEVPVDVPVPGWWPALATFTALGLLLLFIVLYPLHHSPKLYQWAGEGNSWFTRAIEPEDRGIILHQEALDLLQRYEPEGMDRLTEAIKARQGNYPAAQLNLATGLYNLYARMYNDTTLVPERNSGVPAYSYLAVQAVSDREKYAIDAYDDNLPTRANLDHLQGLLSYEVLRDAKRPGRRQTGVLYYQDLLDAGYFDTLSFRPNLRTLMAELEGVPTPREQGGTPEPQQEAPGPVSENAGEELPVVVYTPDNTPNVPFQITVVDDATTATVAGATIQVFYYREAFGREYISDSYGRAEVQLPLDLANTRVLVFADGYREKNWDATQKNADDQWICSMEPLVGGLGSVFVPDLTLVFAPGTDQDPVTYGLQSLSANLRRGNNYLNSSPDFNPTNDDITSLESILEQQVKELLAVREYFTKACLGGNPLRVSVSAYQPVYPESDTPNQDFPDYASYVRQAFDQDPELANCLTEGSLTIRQRTQQLAWPQDDAGNYLSKEHWRVREAGRVVISVLATFPSQQPSPTKID